MTNCRRCGKTTASLGAVTVQEMSVLAKLRKVQGRDAQEAWAKSRHPICHACFRHLRDLQLPQPTDRKSVAAKVDSKNGTTKPKPVAAESAAVKVAAVKGGLSKVGAGKVGAGKVGAGKMAAKT